MPHKHLTCLDVVTDFTNLTITPLSVAINKNLINFKDEFGDWSELHSKLHPHGMLFVREMPHGCPMTSV